MAAGRFNLTDSPGIGEDTPRMWIGNAPAITQPPQSQTVVAGAGYFQRYRHWHAASGHINGGRMAPICLTAANHRGDDDEFDDRERGVSDAAGYGVVVSNAFVYDEFECVLTACACRQELARST